MEQCRLGGIQALFVQIGVVLRIVIHNVIVAVFQQDIGVVVSEVVVPCLDGIVHDVHRTTDVEVRVGHMDVLVRILLHEI